MEVWDKLCVMLRARKVSVEDVSNKVGNSYVTICVLLAHESISCILTDQARMSSESCHQALSLPILTTLILDLGGFGFIHSINRSKAPVSNSLGCSN